MRILTWFFILAIIALALAAAEEDKKGAKKSDKRVSKPTKKVANKPAPKSAGKQVRKPESKHVAKPAKKAASKPPKKPIAAPAKKQVKKPVAKPPAKPVNKPKAKPVNKPQAKPANKPQAKPVNKPQAKPANKPQAKPIAKRPNNGRKVVNKKPGAAASKNFCRCSGQTCNCCFVMPYSRFNACIKYKQTVETHTLQLTWTIKGATVVDQELLISPINQICGLLPPELKKMGYCLIQETKDLPDGSMESCTSIGFKGGRNALAGFHLKCLALNPSGLSLTGKSPRLFTSWANAQFKKSFPASPKKKPVKK